MNYMCALLLQPCVLQPVVCICIGCSSLSVTDFQSEMFSSGGAFMDAILACYFMAVNAVKSQIKN